MPFEAIPLRLLSVSLLLSAAHVLRKIINQPASAAQLPGMQRRASAPLGTHSLVDNETHFKARREHKRAKKA